MQDALTISALTFGTQAFVTLFVILDPPGAAPIFLSLASGKSIKVQRRLAWQAATVSLFVIVTFALFGNALLRLFKYLTTCPTGSRWHTAFNYWTWPTYWLNYRQ